MHYQPIEIVPPITPLPTARAQRHAPKPARDYGAYRPCVRWDAGFYCAFCLVHETDLDPRGVEGMGLTSIEHLEPQSAAPERASDYANCAYACRLCNRARYTTPSSTGPSDARLLSPWRDAWSEHFRLADDRVEPLREGAAGRDARYTIKTYQLNAGRKVELRAERRLLLVDRIRLLERDVAALRHQAMSHPSPPARQALLGLVRELTHRQRLAYAELRRRVAIPCDAPSACRCDSREHHTLPPRTPIVRLAFPIGAAP